MESEKPTAGVSPEIHHWGREFFLSIWNGWCIQKGEHVLVLATEKLHLFLSPVASCFTSTSSMFRKPNNLRENPSTKKKLWLACWPFSAKRWYDQTLLATYKVPAPSTVITWVITPQRGAEITLVTLIYFLPVVGVISLYKFHVPP